MTYYQIALYGLVCVCMFYLRLDNAHYAMEEGT